MNITKYLPFRNEINALKAPSRKTPDHINQVFSHVDKHHIPRHNTRAHKILAILLDGKPHPKTELVLALGDDPRSPLQRLRNEAYGFWLIHNIGEHKAIYQLDSAHLNGCPFQDIKARAKAKAILKKRSRTQAEREFRRLSHAQEQDLNAQLSLTLISGLTSSGQPKLHCEDSERHLTISNEPSYE